MAPIRRKLASRCFLLLATQSTLTPASEQTYDPQGAQDTVTGFLVGGSEGGNGGPLGNPSKEFQVIDMNRLGQPKHGHSLILKGKLGKADYRELMVPRERGQAELLRFLSAATYLPAEVRAAEWHLIKVIGGERASANFEQRIDGVPVQASRLSIHEGEVTHLSLNRVDANDPRFRRSAWLPEATLFDLAEAGRIARGAAQTGDWGASDCEPTSQWRGALGYPPCVLRYRIELLPIGDSGRYEPVMEYVAARARCRVNALSGEVLGCTSTVVP